MVAELLFREKVSSVASRRKDIRNMCTVLKERERKEIYTYYHSTFL